MHDAAAYQAALLALDADGDALPEDLDTVLAAFYLAWGDAFARYDLRVAQLLAESDPRDTTELLPEWEADFGLPDPCAGPDALIEQRRAQLLARMTSPPNRASQSIASFIARAAAVGFAITVTEPKIFTCTSTCIDPLYTLAWAFTWFVNGPATTVHDWTCLDACTAPLREWGNELLQCVVERDAPADTNVLFTFA